MARPSSSRWHRRLPALVLVLAVVAGACGSASGSGAPAPVGSVLPGEDAADDTVAVTTSAPPTTLARPAAGTLAVPAATTTSLAPVTTAPPPRPVVTLAPSAAAATTAKPKLPTPAPVPPERAAEPLVALGRIEIPKLGVDMELFEGVTLNTLDHGPGHWPGTAMPGQPGNVVVAGHRVSHSRPFRNIDRLVPGDEVVFTVDGQRTTYVVTGHEIVPPTAVRIIEQTPEATATLFACHPPGSTRFRWVTYLKLAA